MEKNRGGKGSFGKKITETTSVPQKADEETEFFVRFVRLSLADANLIMSSLLSL